jgi:hypothetical protein
VVASELAEAHSPADRRSTPEGHFLRYADDMVGIIPDPEDPRRSTAYLSDERRGYGFFFPFVGGFWGLVHRPRRELPRRRPGGRQVSRIVLLCALVLAALATAPAVHAAVLDPADATELANALADATDEQDVCYGWSFEVADFSSGAEDGPEVGSNFGPGRAIDPASPLCRRGYVQLTGAMTFTSELSESEDSATWGIDSSLPDAPRISQLESLGYSSEDLLGDKNDLTILNATGALPALVAEKGTAAVVPFETTRREPGVSGEPTGDQGNDLLRENGALLAFCGVLLLLGLVWFVRLLSQGRRASPRSRPAE